MSGPWFFKLTQVTRLGSKQEFYLRFTQPPFAKPCDMRESYLVPISKPAPVAVLPMKSRYCSENLVNCSNFYFQNTLLGKKSFVKLLSAL
jgi:hypothetical protein